MRALALAMLAFAIMAGLLCGCARAEQSFSDLAGAPEVLVVGEMRELSGAEGARSFSFVPAVDGEYALCAFSQDAAASVRASLSCEGAALAEGEGLATVLTATLRAGEPCLLTCEVRGEVLMELTRAALSRTWDRPIVLEDGGWYEKWIAHASDGHWYRFTAASDGALLAAFAPQDAQARLSARLFDAQLRPLARSEALPGGAAAISWTVRAGGTYLLRVCDATGASCGYRLDCLRSENVRPADAVALPEGSVTIQGRSIEKIEPALEPADACPLLFLVSDAAQVMIPGPAGLEGRESGRARLTAVAWGGARAGCDVVVTRVPVSRLSVASREVALEVGEEVPLSVTVEPVNATRRGLSFRSTNPDVAQVSDEGVVTGVATGVTEVIVTNEAFELPLTIAVTVMDVSPRYRALLIGVSEYPDGAREGTTRSLNALAGLFSHSGPDGAIYEVTVAEDPTRDEALRAIEEAFEGARFGDLSVVYITCHGSYQAGTTLFKMADETVLSARELLGALGAVRGDVLVLADCCGSGGLIGAATGAEDLALGVSQAYRGAVGPGLAVGSRFKVIASARLNQDSYRMAVGGDAMATVFARTLCEGAGWNMDLDAPGPMYADVDYDGRITFTELVRFIGRRTMWYLGLAGDYVQTVTGAPEGDATVLFSRE